MIPIRDNIPSSKIPFFNYSIIAINIGFYIYELYLEDELNEFLLRYSLVPLKFFWVLENQGFDFSVHILSIMLSTFLHAGLFHLLGNMLFLYIFGDNVEDRLGRLRFILLYFAGAYSSAIGQIFFSSQSPLPMVGASGAVSAILGAYLILYPRAKIVTFVPIFFFIHFVELPAVIFLGFWFIFQFLSGIISIFAVSEGGVAWWAHIGGFIIGLFLAPLLAKKKKR